MSFTDRVSNMFKALSLAFKCLIMGAEYPKPFGLIMWHKKQAEISDRDFVDAYIKACDTMLANGFSIANYEIREFSCGVYAMQMASLIAQNLATKHNFNLPAPIEIVDYTRQKDKAGHIRLAVTHGGSVKYYEPYAEEKYRGPKHMTKQELEGAGRLRV